MKYILTIFLISLTFQSCLHNNKLDGFIEVQSEIKSKKIKTVTINRGILTLNKTIYLHGNSVLVYKDSFPKWIEDHGAPDFSFDEYIFEPSITDIDPPYVLYKLKDEKYFYVVKNNDTLKFELGDF